MRQHETPTGGHSPAYLLRLLAEGNSSKVIELLATNNLLPGDCTFLNILGAAYLAQKQPLQAYTVLQKSFVQNPADLNVLNNMAISLKQLGRVREAIDFYKKAASLKKDDPDIAFNLALALRELGDNEAAKNYYRIAITLNPNMALAYNNYGNILKEEGEVDSALSLYMEAAEADPRLTEPVINIAKIHLQLGKNADAIRVLVRAVEQHPKSSLLQAHLGTAYSASKQFHDAIRHLNEALELDQTSAFALNSLGLAYKNIGLFQESEKALKLALQLEPNNFDFLINIANLALETQNDDEADRYMKKASVLAPLSAPVFNNLGAIALKRFKVMEAQRLVLSAIDCDSSFAPAHFNLGKTYERMGLGVKAKEAYRAALSLEPDNTTFSYGLASLNYHLGDYEGAESEILRTLGMNNSHVESLRLLTRTLGGNLPARYVEELKALLDSENVTLRDKSKINFCLYEVYKSNGEIEKAYSCLRSGNHTRKEILSYDIVEDRELLGSLTTYNHSWFDNQFSPQSELSQIPIFIIGMPRSGTTLLEREVSRNFEVTPLGELPFVQEVVQQIQAKKMTIREQILQLRAGYLEKIADYRIFSGFFTDKMPQNFRYTLLLSKAFPEAKFLHIFRNPEAVCWSIFERSFESNGLRFAYDLADLRDYYNLYVALMTDYSKRLGERIFHIDYEKFTESTDAYMRHVSEFLNLPAVSQEQISDVERDLVFTASATQVRAPVYRGSSQNWLRFQHLIGGKLDGVQNFEPPR